jgi:hypothetical protein
MRAVFLLSCSLLTLTACVAPSERTTLQPLPDKVTALPYAELLTRARTQAKLANEAFYVDRWEDLEDAAKGLEQTARYLARADDVPVKHKDTLALAAGDLGKQAIRLREAAGARDVKASTKALQRINLQVRELRLAP